MTAAYERAGLTLAEVEHVTNVVSAAEAADPAAPWVAVARADLLGVVAALDRLVDAAAPGVIAYARATFTGAFASHLSGRVCLADLAEIRDRLTRIEGRLS